MMETEVKIPAVGESITSGILASWQKQNGERVRSGEVLFTFETDKVSTEITAPQSGVLQIQTPEGSEVKIGEVVALIQEDESGEPVGSPSPDDSKPHSVQNEPTAEASIPSHSPLPFSPSSESPSIPQEEGLHELPPFKAEPEGLRATPLSAVGPKSPEERVTRKRLSPLRRKIAAQLVLAQQTAAMLTTFNECDMGAVLSMRSRVQEMFQKKYEIKLGLMSIFLKAAVAGLRSVPQINARLDGEELVENHYFDIGVAVGTERGLIVPVVRDVDQKSFWELEREIAGFAEKAREGKIKIEDLQGGVFTVSNGGIYGSLLSTPILNAPQSGILGLHKIQDRPIAVDGQVVIRPMMYLALSYDHRVIDGREAVSFLIKIKESIEDPMRLMLEL